jgi:hypothetical protein
MPFIAKELVSGEAYGVVSTRAVGVASWVPTCSGPLLS